MKVSTFSRIGDQDFPEKWYVIIKVWDLPEVAIYLEVAPIYHYRASL